MAPKKRLSLQDVLNACLKSDNKKAILMNSKMILMIIWMKKLIYYSQSKVSMKNWLYSEIQSFYHQHFRCPPHQIMHQILQQLHFLCSSWSR